MGLGKSGFISSRRRCVPDRFDLWSWSGPRQKPCKNNNLALEAHERAVSSRKFVGHDKSFINVFILTPPKAC
jgi:hypothetical protein